MKQRNQTKLMAYMALYAAIYVVLKFVGNFIPVFQMPNGGSVEIELIALFVASWHLGWQCGSSVAILSWLITFVMGSGRWYLNPMQYTLDYFAPLIVVGIACLFGGKGKNRYYIGIFISMFLKFASNVLSGVYYWPPEDAVAGSGPAWIYSLSYNSGYNIATCIVCLIVVPIVIRRLSSMLPQDF